MLDNRRQTIELITAGREKDARVKGNENKHRNQGGTVYHCGKWEGKLIHLPAVTALLCKLKSRSDFVANEDERTIRR